MKKICSIFLTSAALWGISGTAIAQQATDNVTNNANPLQGTTEINSSSPNNFSTPTNSNYLNQGIQYNNGTNPACNRSLCGYIQHQVTPTGNTSTIGVTFSLGGSPDDTRAEAEKARVEIERIKGERDYLMQLREKLASAIEEGKTTRANIFAIELAKLEGFKSHIEYLKTITTGLNYR